MGMPYINIGHGVGWRSVASVDDVYPIMPTIVDGDRIDPYVCKTVARVIANNGDAVVPVPADGYIINMSVVEDAAACYGIVEIHAAPKAGFTPQARAYKVEVCNMQSGNAVDKNPMPATRTN